MLKIILKTFLGLVICALGFFLAFLYFSGMDNGVTVLLLIPAICLVVFGAYLLMRAGKSEDMVIKKAKQLTDTQNKNGNRLEALLQKNYSVSAKWSKTVDKKDRLKLLEMQAAAEEDAKEL